MDKFQLPFIRLITICFHNSATKGGDRRLYAGYLASDSSDAIFTGTSEGASALGCQCLGSAEWFGTLHKINGRVSDSKS